MAQSGEAKMEEVMKGLWTEEQARLRNEPETGWLLGTRNNLKRQGEEVLSPARAGMRVLLTGAVASGEHVPRREPPQDKEGTKENKPPTPSGLGPEPSTG